MNTLRSFGLALAVAAGAIVSAWAETPPDSGRTPTATERTDATRPQPSASRLAAARELLKAMNARGLVETTLDRKLPELISRLRIIRPQLSDSEAAMITTTFREEFAAHMDELLEVMAVAYANHFTEDEMSRLAAFYRSELGRKSLEMAPKALDEIAPDIKRIAQSIVVRLRERLPQGLHSPDSAP